MGARGRLAVGVLAVGAAAIALVACPKGLTLCSSDSECDAGFACRSQQCVDETCNPACDGGNDAGNICVNRQCVSADCATGPCVSGLFCDGTGCSSPACINTCPQGESCTSSGECLLNGCIGRACPANNVCLNAQCVDRGCLDAGCPSSELCAAGICYPTSCPDAGQCGIAQVCFDGGCADPLCFNLPCPTGQVCRNGVCNLPSCNDGIKDGEETDIDCGGPVCSPCEVGQHCKGRADCLSRVCPAGVCGTCASVSDCLTGQLCEVDAGGFCTGCIFTPQCPAGEVCKNQLCGPCGGNSDCDAGVVCLPGGACGPCTNTAQCDTGLVCMGGDCGPCTANPQCINGLTCLGGLCSNCTTDGQCDTGHCDPVQHICVTCFNWYQDIDLDGWGNTNVKLCQLTQPAGYVRDAGDCDDNNAQVHPGQLAYFTTPLSDGGYDYNCSGLDEQDPTFACNQTLAGCDVCTATQCTGKAGYDAGVPTCGGSGAFCYCTFADVDAGAAPDGGTDGGNDGGADGGDAGATPPSCAGATGTATCAAGACPAGHSAYTTACLTQQIGCH